MMMVVITKMMMLEFGYLSCTLFALCSHDYILVGSSTTCCLEKLVSEMNFSVSSGCLRVL